MKKREMQSYLTVSGLVLLTVFAWYLAANRIYQVDEAQNLFMSRVLGTHQASAYFSNPLLWLLGPLAWFAASATSSVSLFFTVRMIFLMVFLINVLLLALNTGVRLKSSRGLLALFCAATLAPLWDYGFEIRHDNLILTGLLLIWWLGRTRPRGQWSYTGIGLLSVVLLFTAFKSFAYVVPLSLVMLAFPPPGHTGGRLRLSLAWVAGACTGAILVGLAYGVSGLWPLYLAGFRTGLQASEGGARFGPGLALGRLLTQTPLILGLAAGSLAVLVGQFLARGRLALTWDGWLPEAVMALGVTGILLINPTPFPYNLVNLIPFVFLLAFRFLLSVEEDLKRSSVAPAMAVGLLCFTHLVPFVTATWRHLDWTNERQETLMRTAESLTDPIKDSVYDAIGMVPTRPTIGFHWFLHSLNLKAFAEGKIPSVSQMLTERPAAVLIKSYRTEWLPEADQRFILGRYVPLANDFWVLGKVLPPGGGNYDVVHSGRYQVLGVKQGSLVALPPTTLNGRAFNGSPAFLECGSQQVISSPEVQPVVVWVGPTLDKPPVIGQGDHLRLFVNWY